MKISYSGHWKVLKEQNHAYLVSGPVPADLSLVPDTQLMLNKIKEMYWVLSHITQICLQDGRTHFPGCWDCGRQMALNPLQNCPWLGRGAASPKVMPSFQGSQHLITGQWEGAKPGLPARPRLGQVCRTSWLQSSPWGWLRPLL